MLLHERKSSEVRAGQCCDRATTAVFVMLLHQRKASEVRVRQPFASSMTAASVRLLQQLKSSIWRSWQFWTRAVAPTSFPAVRRMGMDDRRRGSLLLPNWAQNDLVTPPHPTNDSDFKPGQFFSMWEYTRLNCDAVTSLLAFQWREISICWMRWQWLLRCSTSKMEIRSWADTESATVKRRITMDLSTNHIIWSLLMPLGECESEMKGYTLRATLAASEHSWGMHRSGKCRLRTRKSWFRVRECPWED